MTDSQLRVIDITQRPWCRRREFQRFLGPYKLDPTTGLYFSTDTAGDRVALMSQTFLQVLPALREQCLRQGVTFSSWGQYTADGNSSAFYSDCSTVTGKLISPHIEMGGNSLTNAHALPHMTHELAHLWWRCLSKNLQDSYRAYLQHSCASDRLVEVTPYAQSLFDAWRQSLSLTLLAGSPTIACHIQRQKECTWVEESFCETVAVLVVPQHPDFNHNTTANLDWRKKMIAEICWLPISPRAES